jgi:hypothetical protein
VGGAAGAGGRGGAGGAAGAARWDWNGIIGTGQSLAIGQNATPVGLTQPRFNNLKLSLGTVTVPPFAPAAAGLSMVPLVEPIRPLNTSGATVSYPNNIYGETPHTAMAIELASLAQAATGGDFVSVHTVVGENGQRFSVIGKGATDNGSSGRAYAATLFEVAAIARLARAAGRSYGVSAILLTHGESDAGSATYEADMTALWSSYNTDLRALTGQTASIPMLVSQQHSLPSGAGTRPASTLAQWRAGLDHPGDIICTGPKYQYTYTSDQLHLMANGYERLGEKYAQVFYERIVRGNDWQPLQPTGVSRAGAVITVTFHVPVPPLAWDAGLPMPHQSAYTEWAQGRGFEVRNGDTRMTISSVAIAGDNVQITCASAVPAGAVVGYAMTADGTTAAGRTARWGQLRDSDPFVGASTNAAQPNYCVAFEMTVP